MTELGFPESFRQAAESKYAGSRTTHHVGYLDIFSSFWWVDGTELNFWVMEKPSTNSRFPSVPTRGSTKTMTIPANETIEGVAFSELKLTHEIVTLIPELAGPWKCCTYLLQQLAATTTEDTLVESTTTAMKSRSP